MKTPLFWILILSLVQSGLCGYDCIKNCACEMRSGILVANCADANITDVPHPDSQYGLSILLLQSNRITRLHPGDFGPFNGLKELYIQGNKLEKIEDNAFEEIRSLVKLDLSNNLLSDVPEVRKLSHNLQWLSLSDNYFQEIPKALTSLLHLSYLNLSGNKLISLIPPDSLPTSLNELHLARTNIGHFMKTTFDRLTELRILKLGDNMASPALQFDTGVFDSLRLLEHLDLSRSFCGRLPRDSFQKLGNLEALILDNTSLTQPPLLYRHIERVVESSASTSDVTDTTTIMPITNSSTPITTVIHVMSPPTIEFVWYNPNLRVLDLSNNFRIAITPQLMHVPPSLIELRLQRTNVTVINAGLFAGISNVKKLDLCHCGVRDIAENAFTHFRNLSYVCLSGNPLDVAPRLPATLVKLNLSDTKIKSTSKLLLGDLNKVIEANMSNGILATLEDYAFGNMTSLQKLDLSGNKLTRIQRTGLSIGAGHSRSTREVPSMNADSNLVDLNLSYNLLKKIESDAFASHIHLQSLDLQGNVLHILLPEVLNGLGNLRTLKLNNNSIADVTPRAFDGLINLEVLHLEHNRIETVHSGTFNGISKLRILHLQDNSLLFTHTFNLPTLQYLDISNNSLSAFPKIGGKSLRTLKVTRNLIRSLTSRSMRLMPDLRTLDLSDCAIDNIDYTVFSKRTPSLRELNLTGNQVVKFLDKEMPNLEILSMRTNNIRILANTSKIIAPSIKILDLSCNNISYLDPAVFKQYDTLTKVKLTGNKFECDCKLLPLVEWVETNPHIVPDAHSYECEGFPGKSVLVSVNQLDCDHSQKRKSNKTAKYIAISVGVLIITLILIFLTWYMCARYKNQSGDGISYSNGEVRVVTSRRNCCTCCLQWMLGINVYERARGRVTSEESDLMSPVTSPIDKDAPIPL